MANYGVGFIKKNGVLTDDEKLALHRSAITINDIVKAIAKAGVNGANAKQVANRCDISENTVFTYCRELEDLGYAKTHGERAPHHPIFGPIVVMGYLLFLTGMLVLGVWVGISFVMGAPLQVEMPGVKWRGVALFAVWFMVGVFGQFWLHLTLDWASSLFKSKKRRKRG